MPATGSDVVSSYHRALLIRATRWRLLEPETCNVTSGGRVWHKPRRLYEEIARDLSEAIARGEYAPGEFLPTEQVLAESYGASRNVTREALKMLAARGMIEALHGRGSRVLPRHRWQLVDQLITLFREDEKVPQSLLELRRILEVEAAALAAQRATVQSIEAMAAAIERERDSVTDPVASIEYDLQFHRRLAEASGNVLLPEVMEPLAQLWRASATVAAYDPCAVQTAVSSHEHILERIAAHDAAGAKQAMRDHLARVEERIQRLLRP